MKKKKPESDLAFFLLPPKPKRGWTDSKIKKFVRISRTCRNPQTIAKLVGLSSFSITNMRHELKKAAKAGYSLKEYLAKGRPFKSGNRVLAK